MSSKPTKEEGRIERYMRSARTQWDSFLIFLYNREEKTVMGRGGKSWCKLPLIVALHAM